MTGFTVNVLPEAEREFHEAFLWYFERSPIAADAFRSQVLAAIDGLADRADTVKALWALSSHATVSLESVAEVPEPTDAFERGPADFADCMLCAKAVAAGCDQVATFDRDLKTLPAIRLL